jgi:hypothetical protein
MCYVIEKHNAMFNLFFCPIDLGTINGFRFMLDTCSYWFLLLIFREGITFVI